MLEATQDAVDYEEKLTDQLKDIFLKSGIVGLITLGPPLILAVAWDEGYVNQAYKDVLNNIVLSDMDFDGELKTFKTSEDAPYFIYPYIDGPESCSEGDTVKYIVSIKDVDTFGETYDGFNSHRDAMQVGFDWNGDGSIDEWSSLDGSFRGENYNINQETNHKWSRPGQYKVYIYPRDQWGVVGEPFGPFQVSVKEDGAKFKAFQHFPLLKMLLERIELLKNIGE